ncbi:MAG: vitamin K epoxide reductase family protein [Caldisphaera sp.]
MLSLTVLYAPALIAKSSLSMLFIWRFIGLAIVPYLIYLELVVLHAICIYCTIMHGMIIADFTIISLLVFSKRSPIRSILRS